MHDVRSYHVDWYVTNNSPERDVTIHVSQGRILGVESGRTTGAIDIGSVALVDGLVNAHTHLEFSHFQQPIPTTGRFTDWIRAVVKYRRDHPESAGAAIRSGIKECQQTGTTLVGEIATVGWSPRDYIESGFRGVVFQELLGLSPERIAQQLQIARGHSKSSDLKQPGLSPHAPYSTHWDLVQQAVEIARQTNTPLAMHLAETTAELELLKSGTGEFREMLSDFGIWRDEFFSTRPAPLDYLKLLARAPCSLIIHGNYLDQAELEFLASQSQMTLVYCPRTHAAFNHPSHPWRRLTELGGRVAIGTDSRASNPDLSLFAELQFLAARHPDISHCELLRLGSIEGGRGLGISQSDPSLLSDRTLIRSPKSPITNLDRDLLASDCQCFPASQLIS